MQDLLNRVKSGRYKAPPVKRAYIPKAGGKPRPIGIPTFEDKLLQRAIVMLLESIYEQDFLDCSYGFRPERSAHQALKTKLYRVIPEIEIAEKFYELFSTRLKILATCSIEIGILRFHI